MIFKSFDGTPIGYRISGKGKETILCFNGIGASSWCWNHLDDYFSDRYKIVTWEYRGHGISGSPKNPKSARFEHIVSDAVCLIDKLKIKKAILSGHSSGFHVALEVFRKKPDLPAAFISCLGTTGKTLESFMDSFAGQLIFDIGYILNAVAPETAYWVNTNLLGNPLTYQIGALLKLVNPAIAGKKDVTRYTDDFCKLDFALFNHLIASESEQSSADLLHKIKVPTLLIASEYDKFVPQRIVDNMHAGIKNSELFTIKNGTHAALFEQPDIFNLKIEKFLEAY